LSNSSSRSHCSTVAAPTKPEIAIRKGTLSFSGVCDLLPLALYAFNNSTMAHAKTAVEPTKLSHWSSKCIPNGHGVVSFEKIDEKTGGKTLAGWRSGRISGEYKAGKRRELSEMLQDAIFAVVAKVKAKA